MTKTEKTKFRRRFSVNDWNLLCSSLEFCDALDESLAQAEVVAHRILTNQLAPSKSAEYDALVAVADAAEKWIIHTHGSLENGLRWIDWVGDIESGPHGILMHKFAIWAAIKSRK